MVAGCRIAIDREACLSCAACPPVCHSGALVLHALDLELDPELCDNCLLCIPVCPVGAIRENGIEENQDASGHPDQR